MNDGSEKNEHRPKKTNKKQPNMVIQHKSLNYFFRAVKNWIVAILNSRNIVKETKRWVIGKNKSLVKYTTSIDKDLIIETINGNTK